MFRFRLIEPTEKTIKRTKFYQNILERNYIGCSVYISPEKIIIECQEQDKRSIAEYVKKIKA